MKAQNIHFLSFQMDHVVVEVFFFVVAVEIEIVMPLVDNIEIPNVDNIEFGINF
jgi:hypothetical protein